MLVLKTSSTRLQRNNFTSSKTSWRYLEDTLQDVLEDEKMLCWRRHQYVLKTYLEDVLKACLEDVLKTLWRQKKYLLGISVTYKSNMYLTNLYLTNLHLTILRRIQNALSRTHHFNIVLFWNSSCISISRIKISHDCLVLWNQLNSNSTLQKRWGNKNEFLSNILYKHI